MKTIWIIDHYSSEPRFGGISRQYDFAKQLSKMGYRVVVVASSFSHFLHSYLSDKDFDVIKVDDEAFYVYLMTPSYLGNDGFGRAWNMYKFGRQVSRYRKKIETTCGKPDVVIGCSIHPFAWLAAIKVARKYKVKFFAEVRDFWPRVWVASGNKSKYHPMVLYFALVQKWSFNKADAIIYSMNHGDKYLCGELGFSTDKVHLIGQPMDCKRYDDNKQRFYELPINIQGFMSDGFICCFAGYYMAYEGVYVILEAAKLLNERGIPIKFVFVGSGKELPGMMKYVHDNQLDNVLIGDRIPKETVPALLSRSDVCIAHLEVEGYQEVYKYGVSKNKVIEYLYSGACTLYGYIHKDDAVATSGGGIVFEPHNADVLADTIEKVFRLNPEERKTYGVNGRHYIRANHSVDVLAEKLVHILFN